MNDKLKINDETFLLNLKEEKVYVVKRKFSIAGISGGIPDPRYFFSMYHISNGFIVLYGGIDASN